MGDAIVRIKCDLCILVLNMVRGTESALRTWRLLIHSIMVPVESFHVKDDAVSNVYRGTG